MQNTHESVRGSKQIRNIWMIPTSGGLDSTYLLWDLLKRGEQVIPFHTSFIRENGREEDWMFEYKAFMHIIQLLKKDYPCFKEEMIADMNHHYVGRHGRDSEFIYLCAQKLAYKILSETNEDAQICIKLAEGVVMDDLEIDEFKFRYQEQNDSNIWSALVRGMRYRIPMRKIAKVYPRIVYPLIDQKIRKSDIIKKLPRPLLEKVWYCRTPEGSEPCGTCNSCVVHAKAIDELNQEETNA